jgi:Zn-dependent protease with chaperone function
VTSRTAHRALALALAGALLAGGAAPLAAARSGSQPPAASPSPDADLFGKSLEAAAEALELYGAWDEPAALRRVADLGYRVAAESGFTQFPISFYLIDMPEPNAFALPAGQIFVTRGMLTLGLSDDELAALLGHEIAHVVERHGIRMERRATLLNVLTQALVIGVMVGAERNRDTPRPGEVPDPYGIERADTGQGDMVYGTYAASLILSELLLRSHSRDFEDDADELGQRWAAAAGFRADSTERLMAVLGSRLPDASKEYGYWRTHPFFEQRLQAAKIRSRELAQGSEKNPAEFRSSTQKQLLGYAAGVKPDLKAESRPRPRPSPPPGGPSEVERRDKVSRPALVEQAALTAWPRGVEAERLRLARIHTQRDTALSVQPLARDYGRLIAAYDREAADLAAIDPSSPLLEPLRGERSELARQAADLYPEAHAVWDGGIWETPFLEVFLSNWPDAPVAAEVALALGEAYSRSARPADAVAQFLRAWRASPASPAAARAQRGLRNLAPGLRELTALGELAAQEQDGELRELAEARLTQLAASYGDLASGAEYLSRFPEGPHVEAVAARLNVLAENLYGEVVLYQSVGDHVKAIERIQSILTHAPASPAAQKLLDRVVLPG